MKEAVVHKGPRVEIIDSPIPKPLPDQVLIKVVVSGSNPKDWKYPEWTDVVMNQGDDIAGIVHEVGENVTEFKPGDRVGAFHEIATPGGSFAEYAISWQHTTFHIPKKTSFEEAATLPLAAMTAAVGLYARLEMPQPWAPATKPIPLVVYGAASAVGAYVIQFAKRSNIHPLIAVAGRGEQFVESMIDRSKGDTIVDYRKGDDALMSGIRDALNGEKLFYAYDAISEHGSYQNICKVLEPKGKITVVLAEANKSAFPEGIEHSFTYVATVHKQDRDLGYVYFRYISLGLQEGWFRGHPQEVIPGGLNGIQKCLENLKEGKASAVKYVFRIEETEGINGSA